MSSSTTFTTPGADAAVKCYAPESRFRPGTHFASQGNLGALHLDFDMVGIDDGIALESLLDVSLNVTREDCRLHGYRIANIANAAQWADGLCYPLAR